MSTNIGWHVGYGLGRSEGFHRVGDDSSRKLNLYVPAAMTGYFDDLAAALGRNDVDVEHLAEIARVHSMEVVGPASDSYV